MEGTKELFMGQQTDEEMEKEVQEFLDAKNKEVPGVVALSTEEKTFFLGPEILTALF
jgi:hypothetical protein